MNMVYKIPAVVDDLDSNSPPQNVVLVCSANPNADDDQILKIEYMELPDA